MLRCAGKRALSRKSNNPFVDAALAEMRRHKGHGKIWRGDKDEHCPAASPTEEPPDPADPPASSDGEGEDCFSDLEDFIVCKPGRDYSRLFLDEFAYAGRRTSSKSLDRPAPE